MIGIFVGTLVDYLDLFFTVYSKFSWNSTAQMALKEMKFKSNILIFITLAHFCTTNSVIFFIHWILSAFLEISVVNTNKLSFRTAIFIHPIATYKDEDVTTLRKVNQCCFSYAFFGLCNNGRDGADILLDQKIIKG